MITEDITKWSIEKRRKKLEEIYNERMGHIPDIDNPKKFTEWLQWYKLYYVNDLQKRCVDKYAFKEYIREKLGDGYTIPLLKVWKSPEDVCFEDITDNCVIKSNCSTEGKNIIIVKEKKNVTQSMLDEIKKYWFDKLLLLTNSFCNGYYGVKPCVIIEKYVPDISEYKLFCFNGKPKFFYTATEHFRDDINMKVYPISFYNVDWKYMDIEFGDYPAVSGLPKPLHFEKMIEIGNILSKDFPFVRVDYFHSQDKMYLAELTFYTGGGLKPYKPEAFDYEMMKWI